MNQAQRSGTTWVARVWPLVPIVGALLFTSGLLLLFGASPSEAYRAIWDGSVGSSDKLLGVIAFWVPLVLCSVGLLITFTAGLWNIGVEGQIMMGAVLTTLLLRMEVDEAVGFFASMPAIVPMPVQSGR